MTEDRARHWEKVYGEKAEAELSWHQEDPSISLELSGLAGINERSSVIDVGGGTSRFAAGLISRGLDDVTVLDVSDAALARARRLLGRVGNEIEWIVSDITTWMPTRTYDLWHDRAVFHFLVASEDRAAYIDRLVRSLLPGGHAIIATFALDGPEKCSGLPIVRYDPESLNRTLGDRFSLKASRFQTHYTPWGSSQSFQFSLLEFR